MNDSTVSNPPRNPLRRARFRCDPHVSQAEAARRVGVSERSVIRWEDEVFDPCVLPHAILQGFAAAYGICGVEQLLGREPLPPKSTEGGAA